MKTSESIKNLSAALNRAQKKIGAAVKGSANPFFKSRYADLGAVMEACKDQLNSEGITVLQPVYSDETGDYVETILLHESGEFMSSRMRLLASKNMQELGSNTSYARRYGLQSMVFIPAEDDDGEASMGRSKPASTAVKVVTSVNQPMNATASSTVVNIVDQTEPAVVANVSSNPAKKSSFKKSAVATAKAVEADNGGWE
jgi:hypothetical protein